jgi:hypothetical protein
MITTIGVAFVMINVVLMIWGPVEGLRIIPDRRRTIGQAEISLAQVFLAVTGLFLMLVLNYLVKKTALGKAMRATAQDMDAAKMMRRHDRVIVLTFPGSASRGAFFGFYTASPRSTSATNSSARSPCGPRRDQHPGAVVGALVIGLIQPRGQLSASWTDVIISILITVMVLWPSGLFGINTPQKAIRPKCSRPRPAPMVTRWHRAGGVAAGVGGRALALGLAYPFVFTSGGYIDCRQRTRTPGAGLNIVSASRGSSTSVTRPSLRSARTPTAPPPPGTSRSRGRRSGARFSISARSSGCRSRAGPIWSRCSSRSG